MGETAVWFYWFMMALSAGPAHIVWDIEYSESASWLYKFILATFFFFKHSVILILPKILIHK